MIEALVIVLRIYRLSRSRKGCDGADAMSDSCGPQFWRDMHLEVYFLTVREAREPKSNCDAAHRGAHKFNILQDNAYRIADCELQ